MDINHKAAGHVPLCPRDSSSVSGCTPGRRWWGLAHRPDAGPWRPQVPAHRPGLCAPGGPEKPSLRGPDGGEQSRGSAPGQPGCPGPRGGGRAAPAPSTSDAPEDREAPGNARKSGPPISDSPSGSVLGGGHNGGGANSTCAGLSLATPGTTCSLPVTSGRDSGQSCSLTSRAGSVL